MGMFTIIKFSLGSHLLALSCSTAFLSVAPLALYVGLVVWANDLGGPLNFFIIPAVSALFGLVVGVAIFLPLSLLAQRGNFRYAVKAVATMTATLALIVALTWVADTRLEFRNRKLVFFAMGAALCCTC